MTKRRTFSPEQKVLIIKEHLLEKRSISDICDTHGIHPNQYYQWQRMFFENGDSSFSKEHKKEKKLNEKELSILNEKIAHKDNIIAEIVSENLTLKKQHGGY